MQVRVVVSQCPSWFKWEKFRERCAVFTSRILFPLLLNFWTTKSGSGGGYADLLRKALAKMSCMSFSDEKGGPMEYASTVMQESKTTAGVRYVIRRPSLQRRAEITRRVRQLLAELEYRSAGEGVEDRLAAAELESRIDSVYLEWGLERLEGLLIDGTSADAKALIERGPEALAREIAEAVRKECRLSEEERKN